MASKDDERGAHDGFPKDGSYPVCRLEVYRAPVGVSLGDASLNTASEAAERLVSSYFRPDIQLTPQSASLRSRMHCAANSSTPPPPSLSFANILGLAIHPSIQTLAAKLKAGVCVAFPTETVYGLGGIATNPKAVHDIYNLKRRPASDPLICHVVSVQQALEQVVDLESEELHAAPRASAACGGSSDSPLRRVFECLAEAFWPGPLSIVGKQRRLSTDTGGGPQGGREEGGSYVRGVVDEVTAGTGYVSCRVPHHAVALGLLAAVGAPVAAPSANRFGRISPTQAEHVIKQFGVQEQRQNEQQKKQEMYTMPILDGGQCCSVGIESTVVRLRLLEVRQEGLAPTVEVRVLRRGLISPHMLSDTLQCAAESAAAANEGPPFPRCVVTVSPTINYTQDKPARAPQRDHQGAPHEACDTNSAPRKEASNGTEVSVAPLKESEGPKIQGPPAAAPSEATAEAPHESPGLCLTHYSPCVPSFLLENASECFNLLGAPGGAPHESPVCRSRQCVLIDGDGALSSLSGYFTKYISLSRATDAGEPSMGTSSEVLNQVGGTGDEQRAAAAARKVFAALHAAEEAALQEQQQKQVTVLLHAEPLLKWGEEGMAVYDRLFRLDFGFKTSSV